MRRVRCRRTALNGLWRSLHKGPVLIHPSELMRVNFVRAEKLGSDANGLISIERLAGVDPHREKPRVCPNVQCNAGIN